MILRDALRQRLSEAFKASIEHQPRPNPTNEAGVCAWISFGSSPDHAPYVALVDLAPLADECIRQMEWARRQAAGPLDVGGFPIVVATSRDALNHWLTKQHEYSPMTCEGCEFTVEAVSQIAAISTADNFKPLTLAPEGWKQDAEL